MVVWEVDSDTALTWLTKFDKTFVLDAVWEGVVALVVAVAGGTIGAVLFDVLLPESVNELLGVGLGILFSLVGADALTGRITTFKLKPELLEELKLTFVNTPKLPIANVLLFRAFNCENIWVVILLRIRVKRIFSCKSIDIKILLFDFAVPSFWRSNSHSPTKSLAFWKLKFTSIDLFPSIVIWIGFIVSTTFWLFQ